MAMTPVEIIAAIFAIAVIVKLIVIVINKMVWYKGVARPIYGNLTVSAIVSLVLAVIIFYFLIQELTIVQIFAALAFSGMLIGFGFLAYGKGIRPFVEKAYKQKFSGLVWIQIIIWLVLVLWVLYEIFLV